MNRQIVPAWALNIVTGILVVSAVLVVGLRVHDEFFPHDETEELAVVPVSNWRQFGKEGHRIGPASAAVTIVEFADFQCPFCRQAAAVLRNLRQRHPTDVSLVYRHYPIHDAAFAAAVASECATRLGRFERLHDKFYEEPRAIGKKMWTSFAIDVGIQDTAAFSVCLTEHSAEEAVVRDTLAAHALGVTGTPTFLVNNLKITGFRSGEQLEKAVAAALKQRK